MSFVVIIFVCYVFMCLFGKLLVDINGKFMIVYVFECVCELGVECIIVVIDYEDVVCVVEVVGGEVCMMCVDYQLGIECLVEVVEKCVFSDDMVIVNVQGDELMIFVIIICQVVDNFVQCQVGMVILVVLIYNVEEVFNLNVVKVVFDVEGYVLYFLCVIILWDCDCFVKDFEIVGDNFLCYFGIYGYCVGFICCYVIWQLSLLEYIEMLEQFCVLWYGEKIYVVVVYEVSGIGVDIFEDFECVCVEMC